MLHFVFLDLVGGGVDADIAKYGQTSESAGLSQSLEIKQLIAAVNKIESETVQYAKDL
jgi:translation elongation factor EF-1alpha